MSELEDVQAQLELFDSRLSTLRSNVSSIEGQHSVLKASYVRKMAELKERFPDLLVEGIDEEGLKSKIAECGKHLLQAESMVADCQKALVGEGTGDGTEVSEDGDIGL